MFEAQDRLELSEDRVLYFRALRSHLAGPGAIDAVAAARDILGAQSQQLSPALFALSQRTKGRPTARQLEALLFQPPHPLVRTWGQRDTVHVYDASTDWGSIVSARAQWVPTGRRGLMPPQALVNRARGILDSKGLITRADLFDILPEDYVSEWQTRVGSLQGALQFSAGRLLWRLALRGDACIAERAGSHQLYAARSRWFPDLAWADEPEEARRVCTRLSRRYLALHGPATVKDIAHFFGTRIGTARDWLGELASRGELVPVCCGSRKDLFALRTDAERLSVSPPSSRREWPLRLLPMWDTLLMAHADKSWTVPSTTDRKLVWKKSAVVTPAVVARGRIVATWSHSIRRGRLAVNIFPLELWRASQHAAGVRRESRAVARHLGLSDVDVTQAS